MGSHPTLQATCGYEARRLWQRRGIRDLGLWCWSAGAAYRIWSHWSGIVTWSWLVFACVLYCIPITWEKRGLPGRRLHITLGNFHIQSSANLFHKIFFFFYCCLVYMYGSVAAAVRPDNIELKHPELSTLHLRIHAAESRDWTFSIYTAPLGI